jgi:hypothetical protein
MLVQPNHSSLLDQRVLIACSTHPIQFSSLPLIASEVFDLNGSMGLPPPANTPRVRGNCLEGPAADSISNPLESEVGLRSRALCYAWKAH